MNSASGVSSSREPISFVDRVFDNIGFAWHVAKIEVSSTYHAVMTVFWNALSWLFPSIGMPLHNAYLQLQNMVQSYLSTWREESDKEIKSSLEKQINALEKQISDLHRDGIDGPLKRSFEQQLQACQRQLEVNKTAEQYADHVNQNLRNRLTKAYEQIEELKRKSSSHDVVQAQKDREELKCVKEELRRLQGVHQKQQDTLNELAAKYKSGNTNLVNGMLASELAVRLSSLEAFLEMLSQQSGNLPDTSARFLVKSIQTKCEDILGDLKGRLLPAMRFYSEFGDSLQGLKPFVTVGA